MWRRSNGPRWRWPRRSGHAHPSTFLSKALEVAGGDFAVWPGNPHPLGATFDGHGVNVALASSSAEMVELCLFDGGGQETRRVRLPERTADVFHGYFPELGPGQIYGFRVHGPYDPAYGRRFNPNK